MTRKIVRNQVSVTIVKLRQTECDVNLSPSFKKLKVMMIADTIGNGGHLAAVIRMAEALVSNGADVMIVTGRQGKTFFNDFGGASISVMPSLTPAFLNSKVSGVANKKDILNLNQEGAAYTKLTPHGLSYSEDKEFINQRADFLKERFDHFAPDVILSEHWPFARHYFNAELISFLEHVNEKNKDTKIVSTLRDYITDIHMTIPRSQIVEILNKHFDSIMMTGQEDLLPMKMTLQMATEELTVPYTRLGYLAKAMNKSVSHEGEVIISGGMGIHPGVKKNV